MKRILAYLYHDLGWQCITVIKSFTLLLLSLQFFKSFIICHFSFLMVVSMETTQSTNLSLKNVSFCCFLTNFSEMMDSIAEEGQVVPMSVLHGTSLLLKNTFPYSIYVLYNDFMCFTHLLWYAWVCSWKHIPTKWSYDVMFFKKCIN